MAEPLNDVRDVTGDTPRHQGSPLQDPASFIRWPWRVGRRALRTIYAHPPGARDGDLAYDGFLIGMFDTPELAAAAVAAHNLLVGQADQKS